MSEQKFAIVGHDHDTRWTLEQRAARVQRVDGYAVDRSQVPPERALPPTPPEAERAEQRLSDARATVTMAERIAAWRGLGLRVR